MQRYVNCIAHPTSDGNLLLGSEKTALFDCGMQFCAADTIARVSAALGDRPLDYLCATHTHYDHIGALPQLRAVWPQLQLVTSAVGAAVLAKDTPRRVIRQLSAVARDTYGGSLSDYDDSAFAADCIVADGDSLDLGDLTVQVVATPGHTRDCLSYFVPQLSLAILAETPGVQLPDGRVNPVYLTSYADAMTAIDKLQALDAQHISMPHRGLCHAEVSAGFFDRARAANAACYDSIVALAKQGADQETQLAAFEQRYGSDTLWQIQPRDAFLLNANATIACTLKEAGLA